MPCTPRMAGCSVRCLHWQHVDNYRKQRQLEEAQAEEAGNGYEQELQDYLASHTLVTFKSWLIQHRREPTE